MLLLEERKVRLIFETFSRLNPHPQTELCYEDPFTLLIAVLLSAQTTDVNVNKATPLLFAKAKTAKTMANLDIKSVEECIKNLNFYPTKAKHIVALSKILSEKYNGDVPSSHTDLEALPGVGRKTANVVLNIAFNQPTLAVDTHIHRVANRLGLCFTKTPLETEQALLKTIPQEYLHNAHHWLILHGRYICKARKPSCDTCPLRKWCMKKL